MEMTNALFSLLAQICSRHIKIDSTVFGVVVCVVWLEHPD